MKSIALYPNCRTCHVFGTYLSPHLGRRRFYRYAPVHMASRLGFYRSPALSAGQDGVEMGKGLSAPRWAKRSLSQPGLLSIII